MTPENNSPSKLTIIGSDNGLSPSRRQAIIRTNAGILLVRTLGTHFNEVLSEIHTFSLKKMHLKMSSEKFCLGLNVLIGIRFQPIKCNLCTLSSTSLKWFLSHNSVISWHWYIGVTLPTIQFCIYPKSHCGDEWYWFVEQENIEIKLRSQSLIS